MLYPELDQNQSWVLELQPELDQNQTWFLELQPELDQNQSWVLELKPELEAGFQPRTGTLLVLLFRTRTRGC